MGLGKKWFLGALLLSSIIGVAVMAVVLAGIILHTDASSEAANNSVTYPALSTVSSTQSASSQPTTPANTASAEQKLETAAQTLKSDVKAAVEKTETVVQDIKQDTAATAAKIEQKVEAVQEKTQEIIKQVDQNTLEASAKVEAKVENAVQTIETKAVAALDPPTKNYEKARWDPIHFKPAIDKATDADCLKCHQEVLDTNVRDTSPAGLNKDNTLAWYQTLDTYEGSQKTFHQRHLMTPFVKKVTNFSCTTCHQGNNPRDETGATAADSPSPLTMRKMVDPNVCLMCHGQFPYKNMGLAGPWHESGATFQNNCLLCHAGIRTNRHNVNFLKPAEIEKEGAANSDSCYGCHGGRAWYRISFPYPRHTWPGATPTPDWAKDRPTESDLRFLIQGSNTSAATQPTSATAAPAK
jgi:Skp family chaperone for outer membrane proteins